MAAGLLDGMRVLDLSTWRPGPYATQLLAEIGADVLKVEPPGGDPMREFPELFASLNANKRSVVLDLKATAARARALQLATEADVLVEGFRPGVADRLGVGHPDVAGANPAIVYCSISGLGQTGPLAGVPGHDVNYQAWAGALSPDGEAPVEARVPIADLAAGLGAAMAVCAAYARRLRSGEGEWVDVSMADLLATWTGAFAPRLEGLEAPPRRVPGYGTFKTADHGFVALGVLAEDHFWARLCRALGLDAHGDLSFVERARRVGELQTVVAAAIARRDRDELVTELRAADVPVAPVLDRGEMLALDHFRERGTVTDDPWCSPATGYPVRLTAHPARRVSPPPALGEHQDATWRPRRD